MPRRRTACAVVAFAALSVPASAEGVEAYDASAEAGILETSRTWGAAVHDIDQDGWRDALISRHDDPARLYRNNRRGAFKEIQAGTFGVADRHGCAWADVNRDDLPDAFCAIGGGSGARQGGRDELWVQQPDGSFAAQATEFGIDGSYDRGRNTTFINANDDGYPDLYVANGYPRSDGQLSLNRLFINEQGTSFRDAPEYGLNHEVGGRSVQAVDYDSDGWKDLLVCGKVGLRLYRNVAGQRFEDVSEEAGAKGPCRAARLVNLDGDGLPDLVRVALRFMSVKLQRDGRWSSTVDSRRLDHGQAVAAGDVDGDSDSDLYVVQSGAIGDGAPDARDLMLLNHEGLRLSRTPIPQTAEGRGEGVAAIDYDRNGLSDFIVTNGLGPIEGPIRLVAFRHELAR